MVIEYNLKKEEEKIFIDEDLMSKKNKLDFCFT